jgi:hypothetical protein
MMNDINHEMFSGMGTSQMKIEEIRYQRELCLNIIQAVKDKRIEVHTRILDTVRRIQKMDKPAVRTDIEALEMLDFKAFKAKEGLKGGMD